MKKFVPGCRWAHEKLLVSLRTKNTVGLSPALVAHLRAAGVDCIINLLSREHFREAGADALFGPLDDLLTGHRALARPRINMAYIFWPEGDAVPTARQVRQTQDEIDEAHAVGLTVLLHGGGVPSRAVIAAGCWLARNGGEKSADPGLKITRLGWLNNREGVPRREARVVLNDDQRAFVEDWPAGRHAEPVLGVTELLDETEPYPTATVEHWLRVLPTVRVYPEGRDGRCIEVPVIDERRVSNGTIHLELYDLHSGTWVGERTLRLLDGTVVVFISASKKPGR